MQCQIDAAPSYYKWVDGLGMGWQSSSVGGEVWSYGANNKFVFPEL